MVCAESIASADWSTNQTAPDAGHKPSCRGANITRQGVWGRKGSADRIGIIGMTEYFIFHLVVGYLLDRARLCVTPLAGLLDHEAADVKVRAVQLKH